MNADQIISKAFLHGQGKAVPPASGSTKYQQLLGIVDSMQKMWAAEPEVDWNSLYSLETLDNADPTNQTYNLPDEVNYVTQVENDPVRINGRTFKLINPNQLWAFRNDECAAQVGRTLVFSKPFDSTLAGYPITVPVILLTDDITSGTDYVQVDDPMWLVYTVAAEFDRNDIVKVAQYNNLLALADQHMQRMKSNNEGAYSEIPIEPFLFDAGPTWT